MVSDLVSSTGRRLRFWRRRGAGDTVEWFGFTPLRKWVGGGRRMVCVPEGLQTAVASKACCLRPIVPHDNCTPTKHIRGRVSGQRWWGGQHFRHSNKTLAHLIHTAWRVCFWETVGVITNRVDLLDGTLLVTKTRIVSHYIYFSTTAHISITIPPSRSVAASKVQSLLRLFYARHVLLSRKYG